MTLYTRLYSILTRSIYDFRSRFIKKQPFVNYWQGKIGKERPLGQTKKWTRERGSRSRKGGREIDTLKHNRFTVEHHLSMAPTRTRSRASTTKHHVYVLQLPTSEESKHHGGDVPTVYQVQFALEVVSNSLPMLADQSTYPILLSSHRSPYRCTHTSLLTLWGHVADSV